MQQHLEFSADNNSEINLIFLCNNSEIRLCIIYEKVVNGRNIVLKYVTNEQHKIYRVARPIKWYDGYFNDKFKCECAFVVLNKRICCLSDLT